MNNLKFGSIRSPHSGPCRELGNGEAPSTVLHTYIENILLEQCFLIPSIRSNKEPNVVKCGDHIYIVDYLSFINISTPGPPRLQFSTP